MNNFLKKLKEKAFSFKERLKKKYNKEKRFRIISNILLFEFILILLLYIFIGIPSDNKLQELIDKKYENQIHITQLDDYIKDNKDNILKITIPQYDYINYLEVLIKDEDGNLKIQTAYKDLDKTWEDYPLDKYEDIKGLGFYTEKAGVNLVSIFGIIFYILMFSFFLMFFLQMTGIGTKSGIKLFNKNGQDKVDLDDIGGIEGQKEEVTDLIESIKQFDYLDKRGVRAPRGILFYGPPGTGKTMLAKAIATNADVDMFISTATDFGSKYINEGPQKVKKAYTQIEKFIEKHDKRVGILFIDELEQLFKSRNSGHSEDDKVLTTFLERINGIEKRKANIIIIGATNHISLIDDAVLSRFDKRIPFQLPTKGERIDIIEKLIKKIKEKDSNVKVDINLDISVFAANTFGKSGRDLDNILNEVHRVAVMKDKIITSKLIQSTFADLELGKDNKGLSVDIDDKKTITYHELGHAIIGYLNGNKTVHTITNVPKGPALGITWLIDKKEQVLKTPEYFIKEIQGLIAGREAERIFCNNIITTGASNDYERATKLAFSFFEDYNFNYNDFELGFVYKPSKENQLINKEIFDTVKNKVKELLKNEQEKVSKILKKHKKEIEFLANKLNEKEVIHEEDIIDVFNKKKNDKSK